MKEIFFGNFPNFVLEGKKFVKNLSYRVDFKQEVLSLKDKINTHNTGGVRSYLRILSIGL